MSASLIYILSLCVVYLFFLFFLSSPWWVLVSISWTDRDGAKVQLGVIFRPLTTENFDSIYIYSAYLLISSSCPRGYFERGQHEDIIFRFMSEKHTHTTTVVVLNSSPCCLWWYCTKRFTEVCVWLCVRVRESLCGLKAPFYQNIRLKGQVTRWHVLTLLKSPEKALCGCL